MALHCTWHALSTVCFNSSSFLLLFAMPLHLSKTKRESALRLGKEPQLHQKQDIVERPLKNHLLIFNDITCLFSATVAHHVILIRFHEPQKRLSGENKCLLVERAKLKWKMWALVKNILCEPFDNIVLILYSYCKQGLFCSCEYSRL